MIKAPYITEKQMHLLKNLSPEQYEMVIEKNRVIVMPDGIRLKADVYRPKSDEMVPALVGWSPYGKDVQAIGLERKPLRLGQVMFDQTIEIGCIDYFVKRGYAVVIPSPRGVSTSEGVFTGLLSPQDQEDCCESIEWVAKQPWCSGDVGMIGVGFAGKIQPLVAAHKPPHLKAIMPIELTDDLYRECYWGGCITDHNFYYAGLVPAINPISQAELDNTKEDLKQMLKECREIPEVKANTYFYRGLDMWPPRHYTWNIDVLLHPQSGEFWDNRSLVNKYEDIDIPVYAVAPYYEFGRNTVSAINTFNSKKLNVPKKLMLSQHATQKRAPETLTNLETLRWYDHWLKGIDTGIMDEPSIKVYVLGEEKFRYENEWPLERTQWVKGYLGDNGSLSFEMAAEDSNPDELYHQPPTKVSQGFDDIPSLQYTTEAFDKDFEVTGPLSITLYASMDVDDGNFIAKMWDVDQNGNKIHLASGFLRATHRGLIEGTKDWEVVNDLDNIYPVNEGEIYEYNFEMAPVSNVFKAGHKMQIEIKTMDKRSIVPHETTSFAMLYPSSRVDGIQASTRFTNYKLYHSKKYPSCVHLPVVPVTPEKNWIK